MRSDMNPTPVLLPRTSQYNPREGSGKENKGNDGIP